MYDPARDIFSEILPPVDEAATEVESHNHNAVTSPASQAIKSSSPSQPEMTTKQSKKRQRSPSPSCAQEVPTSPPSKKRRPSAFSNTSKNQAAKDVLQQDETESSWKESEKPKTASDLPRIKRKAREEGELPSSNKFRSIPSAYSRRPDINRARSPTICQNGDRHNTTRRAHSRSPTRRRSPISAHRRQDASPRRRERSPSPIRESPPRESGPRARPGGAKGRGRNVLGEQQRIAADREREQAARNIKVLQERGVQDISNQFYNARPNWVQERGRDWRKNESKIKGLRSFNNWIKSCIIQKFSPEEMPQQEELGWGETPKEPEAKKPLLVLDIGCGKGGDLGKWQQAPQKIGLYVGLDPADQSISQAEDRYIGMRRGRRPIFDGRFYVKDCFDEWIGDVPIVRDVGIDPNVGSGASGRWAGGGFDVVAMMFSMHYAFEHEEKAKMMLRNVAGALKKGGRFIGVVPNSDAIAERVVEWHNKQKGGEETSVAAARELNTNGAGRNGHIQADGPKDPTNEDNAAPNWGNSVYRVRFPSTNERPTAPDGTFRPPFGWKYMYWMDEAVDVPEYVIPWEAFRALAEGFNLEQRYRKPFLDIWAAERQDRDLSPLSVRMGVTKYEGGPLEMSPDERGAVSFYHAFCFVKV